MNAARRRLRPRWERRSFSPSRRPPWRSSGSSASPYTYNFNGGRLLVGAAVGVGEGTEERVERLVILNTAAFPLPADKKMPPALSLVRDTALGAMLVRRFNAFSGIAARVGFKKPVSQEIRKCYTLPYDSPQNRIAALLQSMLAEQGEGSALNAPLAPGGNGKPSRLRSSSTR